MALQLRAKRPGINTKFLGTFVAVMALLLQPFGALPLPVANAAALLLSQTNHETVANEVDISSLNATGYQNLKLSFDYMKEKLEPSDSLLYGWREVGGPNRQLGEIKGAANDSTVTESVNSTALPTSANNKQLEIYFENTGTTTSGPGDTVIISNVIVDGDPIPVDPQLVAQDFATWDNLPSFKGFNVGFAVHDFGIVTSVTADVLREDGSHVIKTAGPEMLAYLSGKTTPTQASAAFVVEPGTSNGLADNEWWSGQTDVPWTATTKPLSVTITVAGDNGTKSATNAIFLEGDNIAHPAYVSMLAPTEEPEPVDNSGPVLTNVTPANGAFENAGFATSIDASDVSGVKKIALYVIDVETGLKVKEYAMQAPAEGETWKADVSLADISGDGQYDLRFRAVDNNNNVTYLNNRGGSYVVTVDTSKPSGLSLKLEDGRDAQGVTVNGLQTFVFLQAETYPQRIYIEYMEKDSSGVWRKKVGKEVIASNGATLTVETRDFSDGLHQVKISTRDRAGNAAGLSAQFTVDNTSPSITVKEGYLGDKDAATFRNVSFKLYDKEKVDRVTVNGVEKNLSDNQWSDLNNVKPGSYGAKEGQNSLVVFDVAGNSYEYDFALDTNLPMATIQNPTAGQTLEGVVPVTITAKDEKTLAAYSYRIKGTAKDGQTVVDEVITSEYGIDNQMVFSWDTRKYENGEYYVYVSARDVAGNRGETRYYVNVANEGPGVSIVAPADGQEADKTLDVTFTATDPSLLGAYCVKIDGGSCVANGYRYQPESGKEYTVPVDVSSLEQGRHTAIVRVTDRAGNATERIVEFTIIRSQDQNGGETGIPGVVDEDDDNNETEGESEEQPATGSPAGPANVSSQNGGETNGLINAPQLSAPTPNLIAANSGAATSQEQADAESTDEGDTLGTSTTENDENGDVAGASDKAGWSISDTAWYWWVGAVLALIGLWLLIAAGIRRLRGTQA